MVRKKEDQEDEVSACNEIAKSGEEPSVIKIHTMLGKGSYTTIGKYLKLWEASDEGKAIQVELLPAVIEIPTELKESSEIFIKQMYTAAGKQHRLITEQIKQSCDKTVSDSLEKIRGMEQFIEVIEGKKDELEDSVESLLKEKTDLEKFKSDLDKQITEFSFKNQNLQGEVAREKKNADDLQSAIDDLGKQVENQTGLVTKANNIIAGLEKEKEIMVKDINNQASDLGKAHKTITGLESDLKISRGDYTRLSKELSSAEKALAKVRSESEAVSKKNFQFQFEIQSLLKDQKSKEKGLKDLRVSLSDAEGQVISKTNLVTDRDRTIVSLEKEKDLLIKKAEEQESLAEMVTKKNRGMESDMKISKAASDQQTKADAKTISGLQKALDDTQKDLKKASDALGVEKVAAAGEMGKLNGRIESLEKDLSDKKVVEQKLVSLESEKKGLSADLDKVKKELEGLKKAGTKKKK
jgi:chromosome segregation ATPase